MKSCCLKYLPLKGADIFKRTAELSMSAVQLLCIMVITTQIKACLGTVCNWNRSVWTARMPTVGQVITHSREWGCVIPYGKNVSTEPEVTRSNDVSGSGRRKGINVKSSTCRARSCCNIAGEHLCWGRPECGSREQAGYQPAVSLGSKRGQDPPGLY